MQATLQCYQIKFYVIKCGVYDLDHLVLAFLQLFVEYLKKMFLLMTVSVLESLSEVWRELLWSFLVKPYLCSLYTNRI